jgi:hypothetical protein
MILEEYKYLVVGRCGMDDVPVELCDDIWTARKVAKATTKSQINEIAGIVFSMDVSVFCNVAVVHFHNGEPTLCEIVKEFKD